MCAINFMIDMPLKRLPLVLNQIDKAELRVILRELTGVLDRNVGGDIVELGYYKPGAIALVNIRIIY